MFLTVHDAQIFTTSFGPRTGPAILALSGWIGSWEDWADTLAVLSEGWQTIAYDHRGSGVTLAPSASITMDTLVNDVFAVLDAYEIETCVLAAMSAGAAVALNAVIKVPGRFSGLVLVDSMDLRAGPQQDHPFLSALTQDYPAALAYFVETCIPEEDSDHIKQWGRKILDRASPGAAITLFRLAQAVDLRQDLAQITLPTLILHGDRDAISPIESAVWLADRLPNARMVTLQGAGHVPIMTRPEEVALEIMAFFPG